MNFDAYCQAKRDWYALDPRCKSESTLDEIIERWKNEPEGRPLDDAIQAELCRP